MPLPGLDAFSFDDFDGLWRCAFAELDCDLSIPGIDGQPSADAHRLLSKAVDELALLLDAAHKRISAFSAAKDVGVGQEHGIVELSIARRRGKDVVRFCINYENDTYGLWSVDFTWSEPVKWWPVAVGREDW